MFERISIPNFQERYFYLIVLPFAYAIEWSFAASLDWQVYPRSEWVTLVDLCLFVPLLYFTLFSQALGLQARLIRTAGIAGLGLFAAQFIVPSANQFIIADLAALRNVLIGFVLLFEGWVLYRIVRAVYVRGADSTTLERDFAMPAWIAKLMLWEARFWKAVWSLVTRK